MEVNVETKRFPSLPVELDEEFRPTFVRLQRLFRARGIPADEAADLSQDTIVRAFMHVRRHGQCAANGAPIEGHSGCVHHTADGIAPLINRIASNLLVDRIRSAGPVFVPIDDVDAPSDPASDPLETVHARQRAYLVRRAVKELPERHRQALSLVLDGSTPAEVAEALGIKRNAADALLHRARRGLAVKLAATGRELRVLVVLALLKLRLGRRSAGMAEGGYVLASHGSLAFTAAALAVVAAFGTSPTPAGPATHAVARAATTVEVDRASGTTAGAAPQRGAPDLGESSSRSQPVGVAPLVKADVDAREHRIRVDEVGPRRSPTPLGLDVWHEREEDRGISGPILDETTNTACATVTDACATPQEEN